MTKGCILSSISVFILLFYSVLAMNETSSFRRVYGKNQVEAQSL
ncbi:hypothetical protein HPSA20_1425 [Helicobacter pylori SouthAfrica20]|uniref:Uncharacterized protein n=2 Tax=Helicobacter pylori TaxID=210 RepID=T2SEL7_HELPX|nr:hypothetical protein HPSA20_1425 [Helicobacter pylori SouthAfrica20]EQD89964.1 hypothetical protein HPSA50_0360 [Helicobacter pylori SouthAfrica50]